MVPRPLQKLDGNSKDPLVSTGINSGLCSLDIYHFSFRVSFEKKHKKSYGYFPKLVFVEPNNLVISWGQVCDNSLATIVWGQILSNDNNFVPPSYLFSICLLC